MSKKNSKNGLAVEDRAVATDADRITGVKTDSAKKRNHKTILKKPAGKNERMPNGTDYHFVFEQSPIMQAVIDFTDVCNHVASFRGNGASDAKSYYRDNPDKLKRVLSGLKLINVNQSALATLEVKDADELERFLQAPDGDHSRDFILDIAAVLNDGINSWQSELKLTTASGKTLDLQLGVSLPSLENNDHSRVFVSFIDLTEHNQTRRKMPESEKRYEIATRAARVGVWDWDLAHDHFYIEPGLKEILGFSDSEMPNDLETWSKQIYPDDSEAVQKALSAHLDGKTDEFIHEHRMIHKDGTIRWILARGKRVTDEDGNVVRMVGTDTDITELKKTEEALRQSEKRFRLVSELASDFAYYIRLDENNEFIYEWVTEAFTRITAYEIDDLPRIRWQQLLHPEDKDIFFTHLNKLFAGQDCVFEYRIFTKSGEVCWLRNYSRPIAENGRVIALIGACQDITRQKRYEEELRFQAQLLDSVRESVVATDLDGTVLYWGHGAEELYGYTPDEVLGRNITFIVDDEGSDEEESRMAMVIEEGTWRGSYIQRKKDGTHFWADTCISLVSDSDGNPIGYIGIDRDITPHRKDRQALQASEERFRRAFENAGIGMAQIAVNGRFIRVNQALADLLGYTIGELIQYSLEEITHIDDRDQVLNLLVELIKGERQSNQIEIRLRHRSEQVLHITISATRINNSSGEPLYFIAQLQDVTTSKKLQAQLKNANERLQMEQIALKDKNIALKEVINQIDREKKDISLRIQSNVEKMILPIINKLQNQGDDVIRECVGLLKRNLEDLTDPFINKVETQFRKLTPREVQICDMIRNGMTSKEIASMLNTSEETVRTQRKMIRRKLGIANNKINLRSYLQTI